MNGNCSAAPTPALSTWPIRNTLVNILLSTWLLGSFSHLPPHWHHACFFLTHVSSQANGFAEPQSFSPSTGAAPPAATALTASFKACAGPASLHTAAESSELGDLLRHRQRAWVVACSNALQWQQDRVRFLQAQYICEHPAAPCPCRSGRLLHLTATSAPLSFQMPCSVYVYM